MTAPQPLTDQEVLSTVNDLEMMRRPHLWPNASEGCGFLPLKRRNASTPTFEPPSFGVLARGSSGAYLFWLGNLVNLKDHLKELAFNDALSGGDLLLITLVDSGWVVD